MSKSTRSHKNTLADINNDPSSIFPSSSILPTTTSSSITPTLDSTPTPSTSAEAAPQHANPLGATTQALASLRFNKIIPTPAILSVEPPAPALDPISVPGETTANDPDVLMNETHEDTPTPAPQEYSTLSPEPSVFSDVLFANFAMPLDQPLVSTPETPIGDLASLTKNPILHNPVHGFSQLYHVSYGTYILRNENGCLSEIPATLLKAVLRYAAELNRSKNRTGHCITSVEPISYREIVQALHADPEQAKRLPEINHHNQIIYSDGSHYPLEIDYPDPVAVRNAMRTHQTFGSQDPALVMGLTMRAA
ncbi:hypothetical protein BDZ97DRAFT_1921949 [Flammula alnicola]|nr:hypothetical protein BDZ97DRAFT_1921949 [Flammula alnicola]